MLPEVKNTKKPNKKARLASTQAFLQAKSSSHLAKDKLRTTA